MGIARLKFRRGARYTLRHGTGDFHSVNGADFLKFGAWSWKFSRSVSKILQWKRGLVWLQTYLMSVNTGCFGATAVVRTSKSSCFALASSRVAISLTAANLYIMLTYNVNFFYLGDRRSLTSISLHHRLKNAYTCILQFVYSLGIFVADHINFCSNGYLTNMAESVEDKRTNFFNCTVIYQTSTLLRCRCRIFASLARRKCQTRHWWPHVNNSY